MSTDVGVISLPRGPPNTRLLQFCGLGVWGKMIGEGQSGKILGPESVLPIAVRKLQPNVPVRPLHEGICTKNATKNE